MRRFIGIRCWLLVVGFWLQTVNGWAVNVQPSLLPSLIPIPTAVSWGDGTYTLPTHIEITYTSSVLEPVAHYMGDCMQRYAHVQVKPRAGKTGTVRISLNRRLPVNGYTLQVTQKGIDIQGADEQGAIYAIATLNQILLQTGLQVPVVTISDAPRFSWRGFHLDCSRHFFTKEEVKQVIEIMALYKMNRFHWHLTDDQGWRIEIKKYPLLTEKGAWRRYNNQDSVCLKRAVAEENPDLLLPKDRLRVVERDTLYGGYYTQDDIREVVAYARQRGIEVVPEIDMPGHFLSAIENYEGLSCFEKAGWGKFFTTPLCPGKERTMAFCKDVWREIIALFPYEYVHIGGDEVLKDNWKVCPDCQQRIKDQKLKDEFALQAWFIHEMERFINQQGRKMIGWDEIIEGGLSKTATVTWWRMWAPDAPYRVTAQGNDIIYCPESPMYLSLRPEKYSLRNIYEYDLQPSEMTARQRKHILGVQGNMWCEYIPTLDRVFYQYFPRIIALSELGWSDPQQKDFDRFRQRLSDHFSLLRKLNIPYRIPDLEGFYGKNAFTKQGTLTITCDDPSAIIRYTTDGSIPHQESMCYKSPVPVNETTCFSLRAFHPNGRGDETVRTDFVKQGYLEPLPPVPSLVSGLNAVWHEFGEEGCDNIHRQPVNGHYTIDDVCIPEGVRGNIGLIVSGYLDIPVDGIYTFSLMSDDGSWLKIDGNMVVDNDRPQSPHEEIGQQALKAGLHKMELRYYDHNGGMLRLWVFDENGCRMTASDLYKRAL